MVLLTSLIAAIAVGGQQTDGSILARLIPVPTGHNGYEEYLHAADIVGTNGWAVYEQWLSYRQAITGKQPWTMDDGAVSPDAARRYAGDVGRLRSERLRTTISAAA